MKNYPPFVFILCALWFSVVMCHMPDRQVAPMGFIDTAAMDPSIKPGDNFYLYANGKWISSTVIPATEEGIGTASSMNDDVEAKLHGILDSVAKGGFATGSIEQKVGDFYASGMDSATIEKLGYQPVKPLLAEIDALNNSDEVMRFDARQASSGNETLTYFYVDGDDKNAAVNIANFYQTGLGLPDRDYYFKTDSPTVAIQKAYQTYIQKIFTLTGDDSVKAAKKMWAVYTLEKAMAAGHRTNTELRDPISNYHKMAIADLDKQMPMIGWKRLIITLGLKVDSVNLEQPMYYRKLNELLKSIPLDTWKAYLHINNIDAKSLSSAFVNASFELDKASAGQQKLKPRWQRIYKETNRLLGDPLGELYVRRFFTEDSKKRMSDLVANLQKTFETRISRLDWMGDSTRRTAIDKLHAYLIKIGYPEKWRDFSHVSIYRNRYYDNRISCLRNAYQYQIDRIGKGVDNTEWNGLTAQTVDAYNMGAKGIIFPAGILQPPVFDPEADDAINYGAAGTLIGHEMTHGFDDRGALYDKNGNLKNWWSKADSAKFAAKTRLIIEQFNGYTVLDSIHVKGPFTVSENIADLGGLNIAYDAFKQTNQGKDSVRIDGFTPDQRFFLSFAKLWKMKDKPERIRLRINSDPHAPWMYRVNGPLSNFAPFYAAFNVQPGDLMYKPDTARIKIW